MSVRFSEEWLQDYSRRIKSGRPTASRKGTDTKKTTAVSKALKAVKAVVSPHAKALARLAKDPTLEQGNAEHYLQVRFFRHLELNHPDVYEITHATPNGGYRTKKAAGMMTAEGQKRGYPDISVDAGRGGFHGLRIEMKSAKGHMSPEQKVWQERLERQGYRYVLCRSVEEAVTAVEDYMNL